jgi:hypothetical protein
MTYDTLIYGENNCAFPHILGSSTSNMTLHPIPSEFPLYMRKILFSFLSVHSRPKLQGDFYFILSFCLHCCFNCRPSDSTASERMLGSNPGLLRFRHWQIVALTARSHPQMVSFHPPLLDLIQAVSCLFVVTDKY